MPFPHSAEVSVPSAATISVGDATAVEHSPSVWTVYRSGTAIGTVTGSNGSWTASKDGTEQTFKKRRAAVKWIANA